MIRRIPLLLLLTGVPSLARSQARPMVPPGERVYGDIDRLAAAGLIDILLVGVRPYSEREVARLLGEARRNLARRPASAGWARIVIDADMARYTGTANQAIDALRFEAAGLRSPERGVPDTPTGVIDAHIQPLADDRGGRALVNGLTEAVETYHSAAIGSHVALSLNPRVVARQPHGAPGAGADLRLQSGALDLLFGNLSINAGRDHALFGQAPTGGLLLSENAPALDMVRVANDQPFTLPWVLHLLGPLRAALLVADMGATQVIFPHAKLAAYHVAALPSPRLELGIGVEDAMGGRGGEPASFGDRVLDAIPIFDVLRKNSDFQFSNKIAGVDAHWRRPEWRGFELYGEGAVDDFDARRLKSVLLEDSGYLLGTSLSCIVTCGRLGVRAEYHQTGIRYYTHSAYPLAVHQTILGDPLGPRALGGYLTVDGERRPLMRVGVTAAFEVRSGDSYDAISAGAHDSKFHLVQTAQRPAEKRARLVATWVSAHRDDRVNVRATAGGERVSNFAFVAGANRTNWLASAGLELRP